MSNTNSTTITTTNDMNNAKSKATSASKAKTHSKGSSSSSKASFAHKARSLPLTPKKPTKDTLRDEINNLDDALTILTNARSYIEEQFLEKKCAIEYDLFPPKDQIEMQIMFGLVKSLNALYKVLEPVDIKRIEEHTKIRRATIIKLSGAIGRLSSYITEHNREVEEILPNYDKLSGFAEILAEDMGFELRGDQVQLLTAENLNPLFEIHRESTAKIVSAVKDTKAMLETKGSSLESLQQVL